MRATDQHVTYVLYADGLQQTEDCVRASTMEPPDFLGHPLHCKLHIYLLCCKVLAKRLIGTFSSIPQLT